MRHRALWRAYFRRYSARRTGRLNTTLTARRPSGRPPAPASCARTAQSRYRGCLAAFRRASRLVWGPIGGETWMGLSARRAAATSQLRRSETSIYEAWQCPKIGGVRQHTRHRTDRRSTVWPVQRGIQLQARAICWIPGHLHFLERQEEWALSHGPQRTGRARALWPQTISRRAVGRSSARQQLEWECRADDARARAPASSPAVGIARRQPLDRRDGPVCDSVPRVFLGQLAVKRQEFILVRHRSNWC
jgi:hypothetical protein